MCCCNPSLGVLARWKKKFSRRERQENEIRIDIYHLCVRISNLSNFGYYNLSTCQSHITFVILAHSDQAHNLPKPSIACPRPNARLPAGLLGGNPSIVILVSVTLRVLPWLSVCLFSLRYPSEISNPDRIDRAVNDCQNPLFCINISIRRIRYIFFCDLGSYIDREDI